MNAKVYSNLNCDKELGQATIEHMFGMRFSIFKNNENGTIQPLGEHVLKTTNRKNTYMWNYKNKITYYIQKEVN